MGDANGEARMSISPSETQNIILGVLSTHSHLSAKEQSRLCGLKEHSFRYGLQRCFEQGLSSEYRQVNFGALGLQTFNLYFGLGSRIPTAALDLFAVDPRVVWLAENVADCRYEATIVARNPTELLNLCSLLTEKTGITVVNPTWAIEIEFLFFGDRFLVPTIPLQVTRVDLTAPPIPFDALDLQILDQMSSQERSSTAAAARAIGQPTASVEYRMKRLISQGVITPPLYSTNVFALGFAECQILACFSELRSSLHEEMVKFCKGHHTVFKLVRAFGSWNYKILAKSHSIEDLVALRESLEDTFGEALASTQLLSRRRIIRRTASLAHHPEIAPKPLDAAR